jgi:hypothetical protein
VQTAPKARCLPWPFRQEQDGQVSDVARSFCLGFPGAQPPPRTATATAAREPATALAATPIPLNQDLPTLDARTTITVAGYVVSGGDTTPKGLLDAPRKFVYQVQTEAGEVVSVTFTSYPPSPYADRLTDQPEFNLYAGDIRVGDYLVARGQYDPDANLLVVSSGEDSIVTYPQKP